MYISPTLIPSIWKSYISSALPNFAEEQAINKTRKIARG
jgi:hypothetical protein